MAERRRYSTEVALPQQELTVRRRRGDLFFQALISKPFRDRVGQGAERIRIINAESGFSVVTNGARFIFSPMQFGTGYPDAFTIAIAGAETSSGVGLEDIHLSEGDMQSEKFKVLGTFHFHPSGRRGTGFSQADIEVYEELLEKPHVFPTRQDYVEGVFLPIIGKDGKTTLKLLMYQGPATDTRYQGVDFSGKSAERQVEILEQSGFKVILVDIPLTPTGGVDLKSLAEKLRKG